MPDEKGKLTPAEVDRAVDWINGKAASPTDACPVCGSPENEVHDNLIRIPVGYTTVTPAVLPVVITTCANCGFTRLFNAIVMGISSPDEANVPQAAEPERSDGSTAK